MMTRLLDRLTHPMRTAQSVVTHARAALDHERFEPRYLFSPGRRAAEIRRGSATPDVVSCPALEMDMGAFDPSGASDHLKRFGVLLVRGDDLMRAAIADYAAYIDKFGYWQRPIPRGGALWQMQNGAPFRFQLHEIVQRRFYAMLRYYFPTELMLSAAGTIGTLRTVAARSAGLVPFHQDVAPVRASQSLTFWFAIDPDGIGRCAPGLRFIASTTSKRRYRISHDMNISGAREMTPRLREDEFFWTPEIQVGDVVIFDPYAPHASFDSADMDQPRTSADLRIFPYTPRQLMMFRDEPGCGAIMFDSSHMIAPISTDSPAFHYGITADHPLAAPWRTSI